MKKVTRVVSCSLLPIIFAACQQAAGKHAIMSNSVSKENFVLIKEFILKKIPALKL